MTEVHFAIFNLIYAYFTTEIILGATGTTGTTDTTRCYR